jgi:uncharacterized OB-fold protein
VSARPQPPITEASAPFWEATRSKRLLAQRCADCGTWVWYPRTACTACLSPELRWTEIAGRGIVYAVSVHHRPGVPELKDRTPYAVALVELDEGVRMLSNVVNCAPDAVQVGQRVVASWEPLADGRHLVVFEPARS